MASRGRISARKPRSGGSERTRRLRDRYRRGVIAPTVEVSRDVVEAIIDLHWLPEHLSEDRSEVGKAISRLLEDMAKGSKKV